ncbi:MAG: hypothetical protein ABSG41_05690 [Bryobacteraceae bacterium]
MMFGLASLGMADSMPPIWIPAVGNPIASWNSGIANEGLATIYFPSTFVFPLFGETYTSATVSSNGSIYFGGAPGDSQPLAIVSELLQGFPRIAPAWYNIEAIDGNGSILVSMLPGQVVFTWEDVASFVPLPGQSVPPQNLATFQVILDGNGTVIFAYQAFNSLNPLTTGVDNSLVGSPQAIVGITDGYGASDPGSLDLSSIAKPAGFSYTSASNTIYQAIDNNPPDNSNLAGLDLIFTPAADGGWTVTSAYNSDAAPEPATFAEMALSAFVLAAWWRLNAFPIKLC